MVEKAADHGPLQVRDGLTDELDEVSAVMLAAYGEYASSLTPAVWEAYASNITDVRGRLGESELIVAERNGAIVGAVTFYAGSSRSQVEGWPSGYSGVRLLSVQPEAQGQGVARALMSECVRRSRERGVRYLGLHTTELMTIAQGMYQRMGFRRVQEFDLEMGNGPLVMAYQLQL
jgi:ribosomal protein S18 acetylase RimI-like enzyme